MYIESPSIRRGPVGARAFAFFVGMLLLLAGACDDAALFSPNTKGTTRLELRPYFAVQSAGAVDINRIRVTVMRQPGDEVVDVEVIDVDPTQSEWNLDLDVPANSDLTILVELMNGDAVLYSGLLAVTVTSGPQPSPPPLPVFPGPPANLNVTSVSISPRDRSVLEGEQVTLNANVTGGPGNSASVLWVSLNSSVATVTGTGTTATVVTRLPGQAIISAIVGPRTDNITINVGARATRVDIAPVAPVLHSLNADVVLTGTVVDARNNPVAGLPITWSIADASIATMLAPGVFRARSNGTTTVTATSRQNGVDVTGTTTLTVEQRPLSLTLDPAEATFTAFGTTRDFNVSARDANNNPVTGTITWTSSDETVATVDADGVVTARGNGSATIRAELRGVTAEALVTVLQTAETLVVTPRDVTLESIEETAEFDGEIRDAAGNEIDGVITWSSTVPAVATVDANGRVTARGDGVTIIIAVHGGVRGTATVRVERVARSVVVEPAEIEVAAGSTYPLTGFAADANGHPIAGIPVSWSSSNPAIATVNATSGVVTGVSAGSTPVVASAAGFSGSANVTVTGTVVVGPGYLAGRVVDHNGSGIAGALVVFTQGGTTEQVTTTASGDYVSPLLAGGSWDVTASKEGYIPTTFHGAVVQASATTTIESLILVPSSPFPGSISGVIRNARNVFQTIGGGVVELRIGQNNTSGEPFATTTANGEGFYLFSSLPAQVYTLLARSPNDQYSDGYRTGVIVGNTARTNQDIILTPLGNPSEIYVVLTWGSSPSDLDSHLTGPTGSGSRFHVYYGSSGSLTSSPFAQLDVDDTSAFGPETITISQLFAGIYRYSVHNYSNRGSPGSTNLATSGAMVRVYQGANLIGQFNVPNQPGTLWTVFEYDGTTITPVQTLSDQSNPSAVTRRSPFDVSDAQRVLNDIVNSPKRNFE